MNVTNLEVKNKLKYPDRKYTVQGTGTYMCINTVPLLVHVPAVSHITKGTHSTGTC